MKKIKLLTTLGALPVVGGGVALAATSCSNTSIVIPIPAPTPAPGYETLTVDECKGLAMGFMDAHAARSTARQPEAGTKITKRLEQLKAQIGAVNTISQVVALSSIMAPQWYTTGQVGPFDTGYTTGYEGLAESIAVQPEIDEPGDPADPLNNSLVEWPLNLMIDIIVWKNNTAANNYIAFSAGPFFDAVAHQPEGNKVYWANIRSSLEKIVGTLPADQGKYAKE